MDIDGGLLAEGPATVGSQTGARANLLAARGQCDMEQAPVCGEVGALGSYI